MNLAAEQIDQCPLAEVKPKLTEERGFMIAARLLR
jgi:hypothetical protein